MNKLSLSPITESRMETFAQHIGCKLCSGDIITLAGEVGSGKTTFARALIKAMTVKDVQVTSPTFNLMQSYDVTLNNGTKEVLWHLDLYRLKHIAEAEALGLQELWEHITLIEWPEIIAPLIPDNCLKITLGFNADGTRSIELHGNEAWRSKIEALI